MFKYLTSNPTYQWRGRAALVVWKVGRTVILSFTIYQLGVTHGMIFYASDPHAMEEQFIVKMVTEFGGNKLLNRHSKEYKMTEKVAKRILEGARHHCMLKLEELELLQYRLNVAAKKFDHLQPMTTGEAPQHMASTAPSLASSVHNQYGEEGVEMKESVEKGPLKFIKDVIAAYFSYSKHCCDTVCSSPFRNRREKLHCPFQVPPPPQLQAEGQVIYDRGHSRRGKQFHCI